MKKYLCMAAWEVAGIVFCDRLQHSALGIVWWVLNAASVHAGKKLVE